MNQPPRSGAKLDHRDGRSGYDIVTRAAIPSRLRVETPFLLPLVVATYFDSTVRHGTNAHPSAGWPLHRPLVYWAITLPWRCPGTYISPLPCSSILQSNAGKHTFSRGMLTCALSGAPPCILYTQPDRTIYPRQHDA